jgi:orotidine-5'-phosphate decarboxylase
MKKEMTPAGRLIVAADFDPGKGTMSYARDWVGSKVLQLADDLKDTGVIIKVNSALRICGYKLIKEIQKRGLQVFADLKLFDIENTLATDGAFLRSKTPEILTVSCGAGIEAMRALKAELPDTEVLGVTVLTTFKENETQLMFNCSVNEAVLRFAFMAKEAGIDGLISSPKEAPMLRAHFGHDLTLNTPAIRPAWAVVKGDDQNLKRSMTPAEAIKAGADRIVVGRPITGNKNPREAVLRTIEEIAGALG